VEKSNRIGRLMVGHLPALRRYALGLTGDRHAADDLVQDCIERALRRIDTLEDEQRLAAWLRSIMFNVFIDGCRSSRSRGETVEAELEELVDKGTPPDVRQEANEVLQATGALTPEHQQVLLLVAVQELSYREVAEELGVPMGTVMSRLARAREQLRNILSRKPRSATPATGSLARVR
jgi:RNA polymerase sigma-70 factor (ECF subfamily)